MTDRELLEKAARAAGIEGKCVNFGSGPVFQCSNDKGFWHPLTEDGAALRLAVKLGMVVRVRNKRESTEAYIPWQEDAKVSVAHGTDPLAATRRAIVRAAAAMGEKE